MTGFYTLRASERSPDKKKELIVPPAPANGIDPKARPNERGQSSIPVWFLHPFSLDFACPDDGAICAQFYGPGTRMRADDIGLTIVTTW
jgi:hypothetical protein